MKHGLMLILCLSFCLCTVFSQASAAEVTTTIDLEVFHEFSTGIGGGDDDDRFKSNQLYVDFLGEFEDGLKARLKLDAADIVSSAGDVVSASAVEEANFGWDDILGYPLSASFGKDEMPFGTDYDKHLNDSLVHNFEVDKVWGLIVAVDACDFATLEVGTYQHRHSDGTDADTALVSSDTDLFDSLTARIKLGKDVVRNLSAQVSFGTEEYADIMAITPAGMAEDRDDEIRYSAGATYDIDGFGNVNAEYTGFQNKGGSKDYNPGLVSVGLEYTAIERTILWGRFESVLTDSEPAGGLEETFWTLGLAFLPVENFQFCAEYSNFNSSDLSDAKDLMVADGSLEDSLLLGVKAKF